jgi:type IV secretory pathway VirB2 component (pilin)
MVNNKEVTMGRVIRWTVVIAVWLRSAAAWAQESGMEAETKDQFDNLSKFIITVMTGPVAKIIALILLLVGIWKIIHKDYGSAVGCVIALLALVFLPQLLGVFGK